SSDAMRSSHRRLVLGNRRCRRIETGSWSPRSWSRIRAAWDGGHGVGRPRAWKCRIGFGGHAVGLVVNLHENRAVVVVVLSQQRRDLTQLFRRLLQRLNLLPQLGVFGLLAPQDLVNIFHTTPWGEFKDQRVKRQLDLPAMRLPG